MYLKISKQIIMRFSLILTLSCVAISMVTAVETMSQTKKETGIDISMTNVSIVSVIDVISKKTGYVFYYNKNSLSKLGKITVKVKDATLQQVLQQVSHQTGLEFRKDDDIYYVIPPKERAKSETKAQPGIRITGSVSDDAGGLMPSRVRKIANRI